MQIDYSASTGNGQILCTALRKHHIWFAHQPHALFHHQHNGDLSPPASNEEVEHDHLLSELLSNAGYCWIPEATYDAAAAGANNPWTISSIYAEYIFV